MPNVAAVDREPITDVAIDAQYYDKGLKIARLAGGTLQPSWVPADAADLVGLHEAFAIQPGDRAVEISRLRSGAHAVTWIAVYRRSQDASYGDRGNYAGVGVWLLNHVVHGPEFLLDGLDTLSRSLIDKGVDAARQIAAQFIAPDNLPRELAPLVPMPSGLSGWPFSPDLLPAKELYEVTIADGEHVAWQPVAEHILRMSLLPAPTVDHARSLILVRPTSNSSVVDTTGLKPLRTGFASELAKALPAALSEQQRDLAALAIDRKEANTQRDRLQRELDIAQSAHANLLVRITDLEKQLDASDPAGRFKAMGGTLARVDEQARANGLALEQVAETVRRIELRTGQIVATGPVAVGQRGPVMSSNDDRGAGSHISSGRYRPPEPPIFGHEWTRDTYPWVVGILAAIVVMVLGYVIYRVMWP